MKNLKPKTISLLFFLLLHCFTLALSLRGDSVILIRVKNARLDDPNGNLNDWVSNGESNPCNWTGVSCDSMKQSIISIDLSGLDIYGGFPYDFCRIQTVQNLSLANNYINGTLSSQPLSLCLHLRLLNPIVLPPESNKSASSAMINPSRSSSPLYILSCLVVLLLLPMPSIFADPDPLQDFCIADLSASTSVNGFPCKPASKEELLTGGREIQAS